RPLSPTEGAFMELKNRILDGALEKLRRETGRNRERSLQFRRWNLSSLLELADVPLRNADAIGELRLIQSTKRPRDFEALPAEEFSRHDQFRYPCRRPALRLRVRPRDCRARSRAAADRSD